MFGSFQILIVTDAATIALRHGKGVIDEVLKVIRRGVVTGFGIGARPSWRVTQPHHQTQAMGFGQIDDLVIFQPGIGHIRLAIAIQVGANC